MLFQRTAVPDGDADADGIKYVDAREHVRRSIGPINIPDEIHKYIVSYEACGT